MSNRIHLDYHAQRQYPASAYAHQAPTMPPLMNGSDPNLYRKHILHQKGQFAMQEKDLVTNSPYPEAVSGQRPMNIYNPTYDQFIMKPPKQNVTHGRIPVQQFVTSKDRNFTLYPSPSEYVLHLDDEYKNVTSVTLTNASIPNTAYLINTRNNKIYYQEFDCESIAGSLPLGDYTPDALVAGLEAVLNSNSNFSSLSPYTVVLNALTNKIEIGKSLTEDDCLFKLCFYGGSEKHQGRTRAVYPENSVGPIAGFNQRDYLYVSGRITTTAGSPIITGIGSKFLDELTTTAAFPSGFTLRICLPDCPTGQRVYEVQSVDSDTQITLTTSVPRDLENVCMIPGNHKAPNKYDLSSEAFVVVHIPELANNTPSGGTLVGNSAAVAGAFAVIPMVFPHNTKNFVISPFNSNPPIQRYYNPPIPRITKLTIKITDMYGKQIDFEGIDNFFEFRITSINQPDRYEQ